MTPKNTVKALLSKTNAHSFLLQVKAFNPSKITNRVDENCSFQFFILSQMNLPVVLGARGMSKAKSKISQLI